MMSLFDEEVAWKAYAHELREEGKEEGRVEGRVEGREQGRAEGRVEGRVEGREQGRAEGRAEGQEEGRLKQAKETSLSLAKMGMSADKIAEIVRVGVMTVRSWLSDNPVSGAGVS